MTDNDLPAVLRQRAADMERQAMQAHARQYRETELFLVLLATEFRELAREIERENR